MMIMSLRDGDHQAVLHTTKHETGGDSLTNNMPSNGNININKQTQESGAGAAAAASSATTSCSSTRQWPGFKNPRIVRVSRAFGGKDRHSKVCTIRGLRDRRIRLSVPTAVQLYDLQDRLNLSQPSKVIDWLLDATKLDIDKLPPLQIPPGSFDPFAQVVLATTRETSGAHHQMFLDANLAIVKDADGSHIAPNPLLISSRPQGIISIKSTTPAGDFMTEKINGTGGDIQMVEWNRTSCGNGSNNIHEEHQYGGGGRGGVLGSAGGHHLQVSGAAAVQSFFPCINMSTAASTATTTAAAAGNTFMRIPAAAGLLASNVNSMPYNCYQYWNPSSINIIQETNFNNNITDSLAMIPTGSQLLFCPSVAATSSSHVSENDFIRQNLNSTAAPANFQSSDVAVMKMSFPFSENPHESSGSQQQGNKDQLEMMNRSWLDMVYKGN